MKEERHSRIDSLDGLRCIAIGAVLLFHYFSAWTMPFHATSYYPYQSIYEPYFQYGFYGVELFFIISGFVIALTLFRCQSIYEFAIRRFARLWPSMVLCSSLTIALLAVLPNKIPHVSVWCIPPSWTFLSPEIFNRIFHSTKFGWADDAYWSLFAEVRFYCLAAIIYFQLKGSFVKKICLLGNSVCLLSLLTEIFKLGQIERLLKLILISEYLPWFLIGVSFYLLHEQKDKVYRYWLFLIPISTLLLRGLMHHNWTEQLVAILLPAFFAASMKIAALRWLLSRRVITRVGLASYSLYLLHQNLGIALIGWIGNFLHSAGGSSAVVTLIVSLALLLLSIFIYVSWEHPMNRKIISWLTSS